MRWNQQSLDQEAPAALPGLARLSNLVRSVQTPEFAGITFHEVLAKSALNHVPGTSTAMPFAWTVNPYRGCSHACVYCFARPTHRYLELDEGADFDQQIIVKVNVAEVLAREVAKKSWQRPAVALGTNTDPYQRAEGRYALMPGIVSALAGSGTPFSVLTKGSLLRRDLDLIATAAESVPVSIAMSIAVYDDELQQSIEPGTPSTKARLATVAAVREKGLDCQVFLMPVLPLLTDTREHLDHALASVAASGASSVVYSALHLKPGVKQWFLAWLAREHPELMAPYARIYAKGPYAPEEYRRWLGERMRPLLHKHGLDRSRPAVGTGGPAFRAAARRFREHGQVGFGPADDTQPVLF
ncbi:Rv2578c family radical SAM protein [Herbiconiux sp. CPCC 203407]|uniref:Rv2578c family radical SAM protein n=1 Tax=Herbiconiux oxytropis TaxID=2970915 RepID=A0AA41XI35_9MICO|nr:Rv2578c family radical SAM protein [Herbiconiux oxytropis]MCS5723715.1 Rv2578c family radical SAM protein [Herbiconiux oxytropis]MCS5725486.1 Rv2578c family radical SAM protein [Herbiconiux oxytropis]